MKQVLEDYNTGSVRLADVPAPLVRPRSVLVRTAASLISIGTEKAMIEVASKSLLGKALARPDWVRQVIDKVQSDGLLETYRQARARLDMPVPLGYSSAGVVLETGSGVTGLEAGDRVACAGHPYAGHAEIVCVPRNLVVPIPDNVRFEDASFCMLGAIALNAVRLAEPAIGERVAVIGMGLLGLLSLQMLRAAGCRVLAIDISPAKLELAHKLGAHRTALANANTTAAALDFSGGIGVDASIVFASVDSAEPVEQAAAITREQGRVLVPGLVKLDLPRKVFFEKELRLIVPKAGGPGGADPDYEARGRDLPIQYVRWTEGRNLGAFLITMRGNERDFARNAILRNWQRWAFLRAARMIAVAEPLREFAIGLGVPEANVVTIPNGVDSAHFRPLDRAGCRSKNGIAPDVPVLLSAGYLVEAKGHHDIVRSLARLRAAGNGPPIELIIAGGPGREGAFESELRRVIRESGMEDRVRLTGAVSPEVLAELMNAADLACLASYSEGWPNVVLEALACGTPVVATRVGGVPEMLTRPEYGMIIPPRDPAALDSALAAAFARPWDRARIAAWGGSRGWEQVAREVWSQIQAVARS